MVRYVPSMSGKACPRLSVVRYVPDIYGKACPRQEWYGVSQARVVRMSQARVVRHVSGTGKSVKLRPWYGKSGNYSVYIHLYKLYKLELVMFSTLVSHIHYM